MTFNTSNADSATNEQAHYRFSTYDKPVMFSEIGSEPGQETDYWSRFQRAAYWGAFTGGGFPLFWLSGNLNDEGYLYNQGDIHFMGAINKVVNRFEDFNTMVPAVSTTETTPNKLRIFSIANENEVLYDISGEKVATLVNEREMPGVYKINFDGSNLSRGIYFYRIQAGDFVETRKFVILK